jgi:hypothetical protein
MQNDSFSHTSAYENSSLPVYYTKLLGKTLLKFQSSMQLQSKGQGVPLHVMKAHGELEV